MAQSHDTDVSTFEDTWRMLVNELLAFEDDDEAFWNRCNRVLNGLRTSHEAALKSLVSIDARMPHENAIRNCDAFLHPDADAEVTLREGIKRLLAGGAESDPVILAEARLCFILLHDLTIDQLELDHDECALLESILRPVAV